MCDLGAEHCSLKPRARINNFLGCLWQNACWVIFLLSAGWAVVAAAAESSRTFLCAKEWWHFYIYTLHLNNNNPCIYFCSKCIIINHKAMRSDEQVERIYIYSYFFELMCVINNIYNMCACLFRLIWLSSARFFFCLLTIIRWHSILLQFQLMHILF